MVSYLDGARDEQLNEVVILSDGTLLLAGASDDLTWVPADVTTTVLSAGDIQSVATGRRAFLLHLSADASRVLHVVAFAADTVADVSRIRTTELPGQTTGALYISGRRTVSSTNDDGYFIARLDNNFVNGVPGAMDWSRNIAARPRRASGFTGTSHYKDWQPWDVDASGNVFYGTGSEYDFDWAQIGALNADGTDRVVEHWTVHWNSAGEFRHVPASTVSAPLRSGIVLKAGRGGSLRSHSQADFDVELSDGNGGIRPGRWPDDVFFSGPCTDNGRTCAGGGGHTGYRTSDKPTQRLGGIVVDRRTGHMFFGYSTQSVLPGGNPDFEPAVVAMDDEGRLLWWSRLYEEDGVSTPDQYVDGLAIDYANDQLVVLARAHGNNVINFWDGNEIAADAAAREFQNQFTSTEGNIHISWLGKFGLDSGVLRHATWVAEMTEGLSGGVQVFNDETPLLAGYPNPNAGWPNLNTTRCRSSIGVGDDGAVTIACTGRRTITTLDAWQRMPLPGAGQGAWNQFVRTYEPDLSAIRYSTLLTGVWNTDDGTGGGNTWVQAIAVGATGVFSVGWNELTDTGAAAGNSIPTTGVPSWADSGATARAGIFAFFDAAR
jgi:hypothetical protein